jgi:hypothetical protein
MKANELRIGNLVKYDNRIFKIDSISTVFPTLNTDEFGIGVVDYNNIEPIPLTEDWLLKFGFENYKPANANRYFKEGIYPRSFAFQFYKNGRVDFWYNDFNVGNLNRIKYNLLEYVHQLQNLYFALTGKELEYEQV